MSSLPVTDYDALIRLGVALMCGAALGLNRDLHHKAAGLRTFSLVAVAAATVTVLAVKGGSIDLNPVSRVIQGVLTGVGFLGAGVILHPDQRTVAGITTAASVLVASAMGMAAGLGEYRIAVTVLLMSLAVLIVGRPVERWLIRAIGIRPEREPPGAP